MPEGWAGDVVATAKRDLRTGETLDGEGGYCVWGKLMPAADSLALGGLPIGLSHGVRLRNRHTRRPSRDLGRCGDRPERPDGCLPARDGARLRLTGAVVSGAAGGPLPAWRAQVEAQALSGDPDQEVCARALQDLHEALKSPAAARTAWAAGPAGPDTPAGTGGGCAAGHLHPRSGRARQVHADGPVLRNRAGQAQAARAFPRLHGGSP